MWFSKKYRRPYNTQFGGKSSHSFDSLFAETWILMQTIDVNDLNEKWFIFREKWFPACCYTKSFARSLSFPILFHSPNLFCFRAKHVWCQALRITGRQAKKRICYRYIARKYYILCVTGVYSMSRQMEGICISVHFWKFVH